MILTGVIPGGEATILSGIVVDEMTILTRIRGDIY
jgi:hypothetical protein